MFVCLQEVKHQSRSLLRVLTTAAPPEIPHRQAPASSPTEKDAAAASTSKQQQLDVYNVARNLAFNMVVVAVIDPLEVTLSCKPLIADVICSVVTTNAVSLCANFGYLDSQDEHGNVVYGTEEYVQLSLMARGPVDRIRESRAPFLRATIMVSDCMFDTPMLASLLLSISLLLIISLRIMLLHPLLHQDRRGEFVSASLDELVASANVTSDSSPMDIVLSIGRVSVPNIDASSLGKFLQFQVCLLFRSSSVVSL